MNKKIIVSFSIMFSVIVVFFVLFNFILYPKKFKNNVVFYSEKYDLEISLVYSIIKTESNFNKNAVSPSGAKGLMQLIPSTAKWIADKLNLDYFDEMLFDPEINIQFGCFYLNYLYQKFNNREVVICAYNAGETVIKNWIDENGNLIEDKISYAETKNYLKKVKNYYRIYSKSEIGQ